MAATERDYYKVGDASSYGVPEDFYGAGTALAQSFIASSNYSITLIKLKMRRTGSPGTITVTVYDADGSGFPTGGALCSGTRNGNNVTTGASGNWYNTFIDTPVDLSSGERYVIVLTVPEGDYSNYIGWRADTGGPGGYDNGVFSFLIDGSWQDVAPGGFTKDGMFATWGEDAAVQRQVILSSPANTATEIILQPLLQWSISDPGPKDPIPFEDQDFLFIYLKKDDADFTEADLIGNFVQAYYNDDLQIVAGLLYNTTYYWQVQGANTAGDLDDSEVWSFTTTTFRPPVVPIGGNGEPIGINNMLTRKRFIAAANNKIWYEDI